MQMQVSRPLHHFSLIEWPVGVAETRHCLGWNWAQGAPIVRLLQAGALRFASPPSPPASPIHNPFPCSPHAPPHKWYPLPPATRGAATAEEDGGHAAGGVWQGGAHRPSRPEPWSHAAQAARRLLCALLHAQLHACECCGTSAMVALEAKYPTSTHIACTWCRWCKNRSWRCKIHRCRLPCCKSPATEGESKAAHAVRDQTRRKE